MPYYRISPSNLDETKTKYFEKKAVSDVIYERETGLLLINSGKNIGKMKGVEKIAQKDFESVKKAAGKFSKAEAPDGVFLDDASSSLEVEDWRIESWSNRRGEISQTVMKAGQATLMIKLGGGRGDELFVGRSLILPRAARLFRTRIMAMCPGEDAVAVGAVFTTEQERPWLEFEPQKIEPNRWEELIFDLSVFKKKKMERTDRLNFKIVTDADEGHLLIDDIQFRS